MDNALGAREFDAIVVGAGFAGVTAARELQAQGRRTLLLEARDRIGGRTWTDTFAGQRVELGGAWVHWSQPHIWAELTRYGVPVVADDLPEVAVLPTREGQRSFPAIEVFEQMTTLLNRVFEGSEHYFPMPYDPLFRADLLAEYDRMSLRDRLDQLQLSADEKNWIGGLLGTEVGGSDQGAVSMLAQWWALGGLAYQGYYSILSMRPETGMVTVLEAMLADTSPEIRLNSPVLGVRDEGGWAEVVTRGGERFLSRTVVVAVPVNLWRTIDFQPGLPAAHATASTSEIGSPHGAKLWLHVRGLRDRIFAQGPEGSPISALFPHCDLPDGQLLIGFSIDPSADLTDFRQVERAVRQLEPKAELVDYRVQDWGRDEFSGGGWARRRPGQLTTLHQRLQEPHGRIVFATGDIAAGWIGCVDGAVESGLRAARQAAAMTN